MGFAPWIEKRRPHRSGRDIGCGLLDFVHSCSSYVSSYAANVDGRMTSLPAARYLVRSVALGRLVPLIVPVALILWRTFETGLWASA